MKIGMFLSLLLLTSLAQAGTSLRYQKEVLNGALVRAGGPGGTRSMPTSLVVRLCEQGYSKLFYLYPSENFSNSGTHSCNGNRVSYEGGSWKGFGLRTVLESVYDSIINRRGPVLVHCWNGWHAAGEVSAIALRQFCGWSGDRAADYWKQNISDKSNLKKYGVILKRIRNFSPMADLQLDSESRGRICP